EQADQIGRLFSLHHAQLVRYVLRRMIRPDWALAEDIAQDAWLMACREIDRLHGAGLDDDALFPLLAGRAKQALSEHFRVARHREQATEDTDLAHAVEAAAMVPAPVAQEFSPRYAEAVARLPEDLRTAVHLRFELGMTYGAIASRTGWPQQTVSQRLRRAEQLLTPLVTGGTVQASVPELPDGWEQVADQLPDAYRALVRLRAEGLSYSAIAARLGRHTSSVHATGKRAVRALVEALRAQGVDVPQPTKPATTVLPEGWEQHADVLSEQQRAVVCLRAEGMTCAQAGERLGGLPRQRVAQIHRAAVARLTTALLRAQA
ncbi:sigma-70 family RNA polymerase sigma factor, partial [Kitasatospora sp. NPDC001574]